MHPKQRAATGKKNDKDILGVQPTEDSAVKVPQNASQGYSDPKESQEQEVKAPEEEENKASEDGEDDFDLGYDPDFDDDDEEDEGNTIYDLEDGRD